MRVRRAARAMMMVVPMSLEVSWREERMQRGWECRGASGILFHPPRDCCVRARGLFCKMCCQCPDEFFLRDSAFLQMSDATCVDCRRVSACNPCIGDTGNGDVCGAPVCRQCSSSHDSKTNADEAGAWCGRHAEQMDPIHIKNVSFLLLLLYETSP